MNGNNNGGGAAPIGSTPQPSVPGRGTPVPKRGSVIGKIARELVQGTCELVQGRGKPLSFSSSANSHHDEAIN